MRVAILVRGPPYEPNPPAADHPPAAPRLPQADADCGSVVEAWNATPGLTPVSRLTDKRRKALQTPAG